MSNKINQILTVVFGFAVASVQSRDCTGFNNGGQNIYSYAWDDACYVYYRYDTEWWSAYSMCRDGVAGLSGGRLWVADTTAYMTQLDTNLVGPNGGEDKIWTGGILLNTDYNWADTNLQNSFKFVGTEPWKSGDPNDNDKRCALAILDDTEMEDEECDEDEHFICEFRDDPCASNPCAASESCFPADAHWKKYKCANTACTPVPGVDYRLLNRLYTTDAITVDFTALPMSAGIKLFRSQYQCYGYQQWQFEPISATEWNILARPDMSLDIDSEATQGNGHVLTLEAKATTTGRRATLTATDSGFCKIEFSSGAYAVEAMLDGSIQKNAYTGTNSQQWKLERVYSDIESDCLANGGKWYNMNNKCFFVQTISTDQASHYTMCQATATGINSNYAARLANVDEQILWTWIKGNFFESPPSDDVYIGAKYGYSAYRWWSTPIQPMLPMTIFNDVSSDISVLATSVGNNECTMIKTNTDWKKTQCTASNQGLCEMMSDYCPGAPVILPNAPDYCSGYTAVGSHNKLSWDGACFVYSYATNKNWHDAQQQCYTGIGGLTGGYLWAADSRPYIDYIYTQLVQPNNDVTYAWSGAYRQNPTGALTNGWYWTGVNWQFNREFIGSESWSAGEPNNAPAPQRCAMAKFSTTPRGLRDTICWEAQPFICEFRTDPCASNPCGADEYCKPLMPHWKAYICYSVCTPLEGVDYKVQNRQYTSDYLSVQVGVTAVLTAGMPLVKAPYNCYDWQKWQFNDRNIVTEDTWYARLKGDMLMGIHGDSAQAVGWQTQLQTLAANSNFQVTITPTDSGFCNFFFNFSGTPQHLQANADNTITKETATGANNQQWKLVQTNTDFRSACESAGGLWYSWTNKCLKRNAAAAVMSGNAATCQGQAGTYGGTAGRLAVPDTEDYWTFMKWPLYSVVSTEPTQFGGFWNCLNTYRWYSSPTQPSNVAIVAHEAVGAAITVNTLANGPCTGTFGNSGANAAWSTAVCTATCAYFCEYSTDYCAAAPLVDFCASCTRPPTVTAGTNVQTTPIGYAQAADGGGNSPVGDMAWLNCTTNYTWHDKTDDWKSIQCQADGTWAAHEFCEPTCDHTPTLSQNVSLITGTPFNQTVWTERSVMNSSATIECAANHVWTAEESSCATTCPQKTLLCLYDPTTPYWETSPACSATCDQSTFPLEANSALITGTPFSETVLSTRSPLGANATIECNANHVWYPDHSPCTGASCTTKKKDCVAGPAWDPAANHTCAPTCARPPTVGSNVVATPTAYSATVLTNRSPIATTATLQCQAGFVWSDGAVGTKTISCNGDLSGVTWETSLNCVATCTRPPSIAATNNVSSTIVTYQLAADPSGNSSVATDDAVLQCETGFVWSDNAVGYKNVTCQANGTWTNADYCVPTCIRPPPIDTAELVDATPAGYTTAAANGNSTIGDNAQLVCQANHVWATDKTDGQKVIVCDANGNWPDHLACEATCDQSPTLGANVALATSPYSAQVYTNTRVPINATATIECSANFYWTSEEGSCSTTCPTKTLTCTGSGGTAAWSASPTCSPACDQASFPTDTNAALIAGTPFSETVLTSRTPVGGNGTIECNADHVWHPDHTPCSGATCPTKTKDCLAGPVWQTASYACAPTCARPPTPGTNVQATPTAYSETVLSNRSPINSNATLQCLAGSYAWSDGTTGTKVISCTGNSAAVTWDTSPNCVATCVRPPSISAAGNVSATPVTYQLAASAAGTSLTGDDAVLECQTGFIWSDSTTGYKNITCQSDGTWTAHSTCVPTCIRPPPITAGQNVDATPAGYTTAAVNGNSTIGDNAQLVCTTNFVWDTDKTDGQKVIECDVNGDWTVHGTCEATCAQPPTLNTNVVLDGTPYDNTVYTNTRSTLGSNATIECAANFYWTGDEVACATACAQRKLLCSGSGSTAAWTTSTTCTPTCVQDPDTLGTQVVATPVQYTLTVLTSRTAPTGTAVVECNPNYVWTNDWYAANKTITCNAAGLASASWTAPTPSANCETTCARPPTITASNVNTVPLGYSFVPVLTSRSPITDQAALVCDQDHIWSSDKTTASKNITCQNTGSWDTETACEPACIKTSLVVGNNVNPTVISWNSEVSDNTTLIEQGGYATVECQANYGWAMSVKDGTREIDCTTAPTWDASTINPCFATCDQPATWGINQGAPAYSETIWTNRSPKSSTVDLTCVTNMMWATSPTATITLTCTPDSGAGDAVGATASWLPAFSDSCVPTCVGITAPTGSTYAFNSTAIVGGSAAGRYMGYTVMTITCDNANDYYIKDWAAGYTATCNPITGVWSTLPECVPTCDDVIAADVGNRVKMPPNKYVLRYNGDGRTRAGGYAKLKCENPQFLIFQTPTSPHLEPAGVPALQSLWIMNCNSSGMWDPDYTPDCDGDETDDCASFPCENGGTCIDNGYNYTCTCYEVFTGYNCEIPLSACDEVLSDSEVTQRKASMASQTLSSVSIMVMLAAILIIFIMFRDFQLTRLYHMIEEATLLLAHMIVLPARDGTIMSMGSFCDPLKSPDFNPPALSDDQCRAVAATLHYLFMVHFGTLFVESIHNYTCYTQTFVKKTILNRKQMCAIVFITPLLIVGPTCGLFWKDYTHSNTCWLNFDSPNMFLELIPFVLLVCPTIIVSEATGMVKFPDNPIAENEPLRLSAFTNSKGGIFIPFVSFAAWFIGANAVHATDLTMYSTASILNCILGGMILIFHTLGNSKARELLYKIFCWCCPKKKPKVDKAPEIRIQKKKEPSAEEPDSGESDEDEEEQEEAQTIDETMNEPEPEESNPRRDRVVMGGAEELKENGDMDVEDIEDDDKDQSDESEEGEEPWERY